MKMFLKKVNRGLLLGGVLLLALAAMILIRNIQFKKEIPEIRDTAKEFVEEFVRLNITPAGFDADSLGKKPSQTQQEAKKQALSKLNQTYWHNEAVSGSLPFSSLEKGFAEYWGAERNFILKKIDFSVSDYDIEVRSNGPDYAKVTLYSEAVPALVESTYVSDFRLYMGDYWMTYTDTDFVITDSSIEESQQAPKTYDCIFYINATLELKRVGGEWRVVDFSGVSTLIEANEQAEKGGATS